MMHAEGGLAIANDDWISDAEVPDPTPLPNVVGWSILVRPVPIRTKTKGGIIVPAKTRDDIAYLTTVGRVLACGPLCYNRGDMLLDGMVTPWCKVGDYVCYGKFKGTRFAYKGVKLLLLNDDNILMTISSPSDIDQMGF